jgi:type II secretory ATPase GspE/PulE/Tfp pilus assembly ATPase PilB-like protein/ActR/RegA family two-component response regulator
VAPQAPLVPAAAPTRGAAVDTLDRIVTDAVDQRASDIHFEPQDGEYLVRYRVDGVLHDALRVAADIAPLLMSRIKVTAGLDIADRRRPQDGRASLVFDGRQIDIRVSTLPLGDRMEKAVVRILDATSTALEMTALGFTPGELYRVRKLLAASEGLVLVVGPTGSGKTTTLYSSLHEVKSRETNIVTVEDPVEYRFEGINQVQVNDRAGLTFAAALRSILRQDPDVVLVGEIRDAETAGIAIKASSTGHLVLSTLHTNDAPAAIGRLAEIGADLGALAGALRGVVAQRLVRRLCPECSVPVSLEELTADQRALLDGKNTSRLRRAVGCGACRGTGHRGRMVVAEVLLVSEPMQQAIARGASRNELLGFAREGGMQTLWESGLQRVLSGATSIHELLDNVSAPAVDGVLAQAEVDRLLAELLAGRGRGAAPSATPAGGVSIAESSTPSGGVAAIPSATEGAVGGAVGGASIVRQLVVAPRPPRGSAPRVLVVHEERAERKLVRSALERAGCTVLEACDGDAALAYACRLRPDAVVTDLALPRLDGVGVIQALTAERIVAKIFVYTDQDDATLAAWAREMGACDVFTSRGEIDALASRLRAEFEAPAELVRAS